MDDYLKKQIAEIDLKIAEAKKLAEDFSMADLAHEEITALGKQKADLTKTGTQSSTNYELPTINSIILEIRAAAGGNEAGLFASDLLRMYTRFAQNQNWKIEELDRNEGGLGNIKEIVVQISGRGVFDKLKNESGVHRVQRVPKTESAGRIHTSTATVAVLPEVEQTQIEINPKDLEFEAFRSGGHGGQNVNKVSTAVRIKHIPTGIVVKSQTERSQAQNREIAMGILRSKIYAQEEESKSSQLGNLRLAQVGAGDRSEKIRTYNFPQDRVTDHRIGKSWGNLENVMNGKLDKIIDSLADASHQKN
ncbi:peptide chain release factor 1 [Candidatus Curtissbacteria bacterium RIFCSPHIGHO2_02_FULL_42_15]|uniref:Peptide chain release factor 1 n=1 Tax=Candidatus Curtissbacteria bacterium RIFCSPHIGHO2_02_FULL_42_15 TaxID=1797716 RepID=A0A1F5GIX0_9BACT|nr:MAG: peptide chain release factor 1 [Candidatus Curtissbacteria bacterium RIFCSPHIGHO2_02_FULL_42_15]